MNLKNAKICSLHFAEEEFLRDLRSELLKEPSRLILKPNAIPTLRLGSFSNVEIGDSSYSCLLTNPANDYYEVSSSNSSESDDFSGLVDELREQVVKLASRNCLLRKKLLLQSVELRKCREQLCFMQKQRKAARNVRNLRRNKSRFVSFTLY